MTDVRSRQYDGQAAVRPASDDSVPLREHLEKLIDDLRIHSDSSLIAHARRFDDLRAADMTALDAAFASSDKAIHIALEGQKAEAARIDAATDKRLDSLNKMREGVAMSADVEAVKANVAVEFRALNEKMADLKELFNSALARSDGRAGGLKDYVGWLVALASIIGLVATLLAKR